MVLYAALTCLDGSPISTEALQPEYTVHSCTAVKCRAVFLAEEKLLKYVLCLKH